MSSYPVRLTADRSVQLYALVFLGGLVAVVSFGSLFGPMMEHLLSLILFLPVAGMLALLLIPAERKALVRLWANGILLRRLPDFAAAGDQLRSRRVRLSVCGTRYWIPSIGATAT